MDKLVQHIKMDMPGFPKQGLYCYGEASFEANQAIQEPLQNACLMIGVWFIYLQNRH